MVPYVKEKPTFLPYFLTLVFNLSWSGSWGLGLGLRKQQPQQGSPDCPLPHRFHQFLLRNSESLPRWTCPKTPALGSIQEVSLPDAQTTSTGSFRCWGAPGCPHPLLLEITHFIRSYPQSHSSGHDCWFAEFLLVKHAQYTSFSTISCINQGVSQQT